MIRYLHTMIRVTDPDATVKFFELLGLKETRRMNSEAGRFTLIFLATPEDISEPDSVPVRRSNSPITGRRKTAARPRPTRAGATSAISPITWTTFTRRASA